MTANRRDFIIGASAAVAWSRFAQAQPHGLVVGVLHSASPDPSSAYWPAIGAFRHGLAEAGFVESKNLSLDFQWANDHFERLPELATELVKRNPALIFVGGGDVAALAAKNATGSIPIVFAIGADPVKQGIVSSLSRPEGNLTGVTFLSVELRPKMLELIRELVPHASTIAVLGNPLRPNFQALLDEVVRPAHSFGLNVVVLQAATDAEITSAFENLGHQHVDGMLVLSDPVYFNRRDQLARLELEYRIPSIFTTRGHVTAGGLASYGASITDAYYQAGLYAGRILNGEKPADLPVMQPTKFELVINVKTAKALGITIPDKLLALADEVIE